MKNTIRKTEEIIKVSSNSSKLMIPFKINFEKISISLFMDEISIREFLEPLSRELNPSVHDDFISVYQDGIKFAKKEINDVMDNIQKEETSKINNKKHGTSKRK